MVYTLGMPITKRSQASHAVPRDEKITINLGTVDLGQVDLLVAEGLYANRTDLIRTAIRNQVARHDGVVQAAVARKTMAVGMRHVTADELRAALQQGKRVSIRVLGLAVIAPDVSAKLAAATIESIEVLGHLQANTDIKAALQGRIF